MENINSERLVAYQKNPFLSLIVWLLLIIGSMFIAVEASNFILTSTTDLTQTELFKLNSESNVSSHTKYMILIGQGVTSIFTFIFPAILFFIFYNKASFGELTGPFSKHLNTYLLVGFILFSFFIVNTLFIEINAKLQLPSSLSEMENLIQDLENQLKEFTQLLTQFESPLYFSLSVLIIAIIPAIGEELIFRGLLQNILRAIAGNYHVAIWISAFLFSAIHFQFYGFLPRLLLGALFGYVYVWSGNLLLPILAHFLNNFISLVLVYIYQLNITKVNVESEESLPIWTITIFTVIFVYLMYTFYKYFRMAGGKNGQLEKSF